MTAIHIATYGTKYGLMNLGTGRRGGREGRGWERGRGEGKEGRERRWGGRGGGKGRREGREGGKGGREGGEEGGKDTILLLLFPIFIIQAVLGAVGTVAFAIVEWRHYRIPSLVNEGKKRPITSSGNFSQ